MKTLKTVYDNNGFARMDRTLFMIIMFYFFVQVIYIELRGDEYDKG